jgi:hypothetical protein
VPICDVADEIQLTGPCTGGSRPRGISFFIHETFALLIYWVNSGGTGRPAAVYEGRTELCPSGFFNGNRARVLLFGISMFDNYVGATELLESR